MQLLVDGWEGRTRVGIVIFMVSESMTDGDGVWVSKHTGGDILYKYKQLLTTSYASYHTYHKHNPNQHLNSYPQPVSY